MWGERMGCGRCGGNVWVEMWGERMGCGHKCPFFLHFGGVVGDEGRAGWTLSDLGWQPTSKLELGRLEYIEFTVLARDTGAIQANIPVLSLVQITTRTRHVSRHVVHAEFVPSF